LFVIFYLLLVIACCLLPVDMLSITVELNHVMCWYTAWCVDTLSPFSQSMYPKKTSQTDKRVLKH